MRLSLRQWPRTLAVLGGLGVALAVIVAPGGASAAGPPHFLSLPFASASHIHIQRGWWTKSSDGTFDLLEHGFDYIKGTQDVIPSWKSFDVVASAPGEACAAKIGQHGCVDYPGEIMGNRVLVKHVIDGVTYYTFYNHLKTIAPGIPLNNRNHTVHVSRGQFLGKAGASGDDPSLIHLFFELDDANLKPIDPYGIYGSSRQYPDPAGGNSIHSAKKNYFLTNPPTVAGAEPPPSPTPRPTKSPKPSPAPTSPGATPTGAANTEAPTASAAGPPASTAAGATPTATSLAVVGTPAPSATGPPSAAGGGGTDPLPAVLAAGAVVIAGVLLLLFLLRRRGGSISPR
jgi:hypothetical protein